MESGKERVASLSTIRRLPMYLNVLKQFRANGREFVSTTHLAQDLDFQPDQIRKDLAVTGIVGKPKAGYYIPALIEAIQSFLRWDNNTDAFLVGVGNLGSALLGYEGFRSHGIEIVAAFDADAKRVGRIVAGMQILPIDKLTDLAERMHVHMGIIAVPAEHAQSVADEMVAGGIVAIWNFAPTSLKVPEGVVVQNEDLSVGLAVLSVKLDRAMKAKAHPDSVE